MLTPLSHPKPGLAAADLVSWWLPSPLHSPSRPDDFSRFGACHTPFPCLKTSSSVHCLLSPTTVKLSSLLSHHRTPSQLSTPQVCLGVLLTGHPLPLGRALSPILPLLSTGSKHAPRPIFRLPPPWGLLWLPPPCFPLLLHSAHPNYGFLNVYGGSVLLLCSLNTSFICPHHRAFALAVPLPGTRHPSSSHGCLSCRSGLGSVFISLPSSQTGFPWLSLI